MLIIGVDGPTSIFLAGKLGMGWINFFGLLIVLLLGIPNVINRVKFHNVKSVPIGIKGLKLVGWFASAIFIIIPIGLSEFGFSSVSAFIVYLCSNAVLLIVYWVIWMLYFSEQKRWQLFALAIIPAILFFVNGLILNYLLLMISAVVLGIGNISQVKSQ